MKINDKHLTHFASCGGSTELEGWLWKKGELNTSYQKRWCVLKGNLFFYFDRKSDREPIGVIVLENCFVQLAEGGDSPYTFSIHFTGESTRVYKLTADDESSCMSWVKALSICSYRYLEILVDGLTREVEILKATKSENERSNSICIPSNSSNVQITLDADSDSDIHEHCYSSSLTKSSSMNDIVERAEEVFVDTNEEYLDFDIFSHERNALSKSSSSLTRSKSSGELHSAAVKLPVHESLSMKTFKSPSRKQKSAVMRRLSPRMGRKKYANPKAVQQELLSVSSLGSSSRDSFKTIPTYSNVMYNFLEMHEKFRTAIEDFVK